MRKTLFIAEDSPRIPALIGTIAPAPGKFS